jgi:hypothetical protein
MKSEQQKFNVSTNNKNYKLMNKKFKIALLPYLFYEGDFEPYLLVEIPNWPHIKVKELDDKFTKKYPNHQIKNRIFLFCFDVYFKDIDETINDIWL